MRRRRFELAAWEVYECGKQWRESDADVAEAIDYCNYYGREMLRLARAQHFDVPGEENAYFYEPRGVTVVIAPWNFPLAILCGMTTAALVTGNPLLMKPAEQSSVIGAKLMEVFQEVGLPPGVVSYLPGVGEEIGPTLTNHPDVAKGKAESRLAFAGDVGALADEGYFVGPHVFADVPPTAVIAREEIFGPVLAVIKARDLTHALEIANGTPYALTGGLYTRSPQNIARVRREFRVGNLYINRKITGALVGRQPFGGFKLSGIGSKAGGPDYLLQFVLPRTITENTMRRGFAPADDVEGHAAP